VPSYTEKLPVINALAGSGTIDPKSFFGITRRQERFAVAYARGDVTPSEAAMVAGYASPESAGPSLLREDKYPNVVKRIMDIKAELAKKYEVTFENHVAKLATIRDAAMANNNFAAAVAAEKNRGAAAGLYVTRSEILVGRIDQMSKDEVFEEIRKLQKELGLTSGEPTKNVIEDVPFSVVVGDPEEFDPPSTDDISGGADLYDEEAEDFEASDRGRDLEEDQALVPERYASDKSRSKNRRRAS
jgi:phage terminase small subunit